MLQRCQLYGEGDTYRPIKAAYRMLWELEDEIVRITGLKDSDINTITSAKLL